jgi:hypothetical protein
MISSDWGQSHKALLKPFHSWIQQRRKTIIPDGTAKLKA